jgi:hypothetical protein
MAEFDLLGYKLVVEPLAGGRYKLYLIDSDRRPTGWFKRVGREPWLSWIKYRKEIAREINQPEEKVAEALKEISKRIFLEGARNLGLVPPDELKLEDGSSFEKAMAML